MPTKIPKFFQPLLWSYRFSRLEPERDLRPILVQTVNYGQWRHWQWLRKHYRMKAIQQALRQIPQSEFRPPALRLARLVFKVNEPQHASRRPYPGREKTLAKA